MINFAYLFIIIILHNATHLLVTLSVFEYIDIIFTSSSRADSTFEGNTKQENSFIKFMEILKALYVHH